MYKCVDCGHIFDEGEDRIYTKRGELIYGYCPICGSEEYEEASRCTNCGGAFLEDELFWGWCLECLNEEITYDKAYEYFREELDFFHLFMFESVFKMRLPSDISDEMTEHLFEVYNRMKANDLLTNSTEFIDLIKRFILEEDKDYGKIHYAEWLDDRKRKGVR